jgi:hypothetical protein
MGVLYIQMPLLASEQPRWMSVLQEMIMPTYRRVGYLLLGTAAVALLVQALMTMSRSELGKALLLAGMMAGLSAEGIYIQPVLDELAVERIAVGGMENLALERRWAQWQSLSQGLQWGLGVVGLILWVGELRRVIRTREL